MSAVFLVSLAGSGGERSRVEKVKSKMLSCILWVQSTCSVIMEPVSLRIFLSMSLDDVLITIDKTELG